MKKLRQPFFAMSAALVSMFLLNACDEGSSGDKKDPCADPIDPILCKFPCRDGGEMDYTKKTEEEIIDYLICKKVIGDEFKTERYTKSTQEVGSPCYCYGSDCTMAGYKRPDQGKIYGCDNVIDEHQGAKRSCLQSTDAPGIKPVIYFTNGTCTLMLAKCEPVSEGAQETICGMASIGDTDNYDAFTHCPDNKDALVQFELDVQVLSETAVLATKVCMPTCTTDADCRSDEKDAVFSSQMTERKCYQDSVTDTKFCMDIRNAGAKGITVIDPGTPK